MKRLELLKTADDLDIGEGSLYKPFPEHDPAWAITWGDLYNAAEEMEIETISSDEWSSILEKIFNSDELSNWPTIIASAIRDVKSGGEVL